MASSGTFATLSPSVQLGSSTINRSTDVENGGLYQKVQSSENGPPSTIGMHTSGKYYWEVHLTSYNSTKGVVIGISNQHFNIDAELNWNSPSSPTGADVVSYYLNNGKIGDGIGDGSNFVSYGTQASQGQIIGVALDMDNGKIFFAKNNTWENSGNPETGTNPARGAGGAVTDAMDFTTNIWYTSAGSWSSGNDERLTWNFGQDSSFQGAVTGQGNTDGNGFGDFYYSPPTGYLALCSANMPVSENVDPVETDDDIPPKQFNCIGFTGTGSTQAITGLGLQPDLVVIKNRSGTQGTKWTDSSRGTTKVLQSATTSAESTDTGGLTAFGTDGFTVGNDAGYNGSTNNIIAWGWRANGGTTSTNTEGTHTCTLQANQNAGFSIATLANYTSSTGVTIGHGLGKKPAFYIHKSSSSTGNWHVYHHSLGATKAMLLNSGAGVATAVGYWANTEPTTSVLSLGNTLAGTSDGVVYAWSEIQGYSKFGIYDSNQQADGPYNYCGFRPRVVFIKMTVTGDGWGIWDSVRGPENPIDNIVQWNTSTSENSNSYFEVDFLSCGFKISANNAQINHNSYDPYIWGAWADVPFKYANTHP